MGEGRGRQQLARKLWEQTKAGNGGKGAGRGAGYEVGQVAVKPGYGVSN